MEGKGTRCGFPQTPYVTMSLTQVAEFAGAAYAGVQPASPTTSQHGFTGLFREQVASPLHLEATTAWFHLQLAGHGHKLCSPLHPHHLCLPHLCPVPAACALPSMGRATVEEPMQGHSWVVESQHLCLRQQSGRQRV